MRWESLFADLEAQLNAEEARERVAEIQEMVRIERSQVGLWDRMAGSVGSDAVLGLLGGLRLRGRIQHVGAQWLSLAVGPVEYFVPASGLRSVEGAGLRVAPAAAPGRRLVSRGAALRELVRDRARVTVWSVDGQRLGTGTLDQAGRDFLQLAQHSREEFRRSADVRGVSLIPLTAVAALAREA
jgi:hypothetical protein